MEDYAAAEELIKSELSAELSKLETRNSNSKIVCPICSRKINGTANLSFHMALHPVANPFSCDHCVQIFRTKEELVSHVRSDHDHDVKFKCDTCGQILQNSWSLRRHKKIHKAGADFKCLYCDAEFRGYNSYRLHEVRHTDPTNFKCDLCEVGFNTDELLTKHVMTAKCTAEVHCCGMVFKKRLHYVDHFLATHRRNHLEEHSCKFCKKLFPFPSARNYHEKRCAKGLTPRYHNTYLDDPTVPQSNEHGVYTCEICSMVCNSVSGLRTHHNRIHEVQTPMENGKCVCSLCNKEFANRARLSMHRLNVHLKPHTCKECGKRFAHNFLLRKHMYNHNQQPKPFACEYCDKTFMTKKTLSDHENIHTGNRPYKCQICECSYKKQSSLFYHVLKHKGEKPYKCKICGTAFSHTSSCRQHEKAHSRTDAKKKFQCSDCSAIFWTSAQLRSHQESMHRQHKEPPVVEKPVYQAPLATQIQTISDGAGRSMNHPSHIAADEVGNIYYRYYM